MGRPQRSQSWYNELLPALVWKKQIHKNAGDVVKNGFEFKSKSEGIFCFLDVSISLE